MACLAGEEYTIRNSKNQLGGGGGGGGGGGTCEFLRIFENENLAIFAGNSH